MDAAVRRRLKVILGGLSGPQTAAVATVADPQGPSGADPAISAQVTALQASVDTMKADLAVLQADADAVTLKTVFRDKDGFITHVVETTVTPDELDQALKETPR